MVINNCFVSCATHQGGGILGQFQTGLINVSCATNHGEDMLFYINFKKLLHLWNFKKCRRHDHLVIKKIVVKINAVGMTLWLEVFKTS